MPPDAWSPHLPAGAWLPDGGPGAGTTLPQRWAARWAREPGAAVLHAAGEEGDRAASWRTAASIEASSRAVGDGLAASGVGPGDRVAWWAAPSHASIGALVGALRTGVVVVPVNPAATARELAVLLGDVRPRVAIVDLTWYTPAFGATRAPPAVLDAAALARGTSTTGAAGTAPVDPGPDDPALIVYTSGTTGRPKGALLTHGNLAAAVAALELAWRWDPDDRLVSALPLFHVHGLAVALLGSLTVGGSLVLLPRFDAGGVLDAATTHRASLFFGVPTMYHRIVASGRGSMLAGLRLNVSGSAPLPAALWHTLGGSCGVPVLERYGMTETLLTVSNPYEGERRPGSVGFPLPGVEVAVGAAGGHADEVAVRGPTVFAGYWERPSATAECMDAGWFRTGDLGGFDEDGYLVLRGRAKDLIISGGYNVYPAEVEDALLGHPGVAEVAVVGTPSDEWGEVVTAFVVLAAPGTSTDELAAYAAERLAPYKRPRAIHLTDQLPRNELGKVQRQQLR